VEGERRRLHGEADQQGGHDEPPGHGTALQRRVRGEGHHVEGVRGRGQVQPDEPQQQGEGPEEGVEEELQRRAGGVAVAPSGDDEVHAHDGQVEEDEEQDEVLRGEDPQTAGLQEQEQRGVGSGPVPLAQRVHRAREEHDRSERHERQRQPVQADVVAAAHAGDPAHLFGEHQPAGDAARAAAAGQPRACPDADHEQQVERGHRHPRPPRGALRHPRCGDEHGGGRERQEDHQAEHSGHLTRSRSAVATARTATTWA